jgi:hypothetical protein
MRFLAIALILALVFGGLVDACEIVHADDANLGCVGACCQPGFVADARATVAMPLPQCERLTCRPDGPADELLARSYFRPPEVA